MFKLAVLALVLSCAAADEWNEADKGDILKYKECDNLETFQEGLVGWWEGRKQIDSEHYHREYDLHNVVADGSGIVNALSDKDNDKLQRETPTHMWCKKYDNGVDKAVLVQYGPTKYGQLICISLELSASRPDEMLVSVNQALFTDPRIPHSKKYSVSLNCLNYPYMSKYNSYTIWADQFSTKSYSKWYRTVAPEKGSDWDMSEKKSSNLMDLLRLLSKSKA